MAMIWSLTVDADDTGGDSFPNSVPRFAHVGAGVFRVSVEYIESDVTEIVSGLEFVTLRNRSAVPEPLDYHRWVVDGR